MRQFLPTLGAALVLTLAGNAATAQQSPPRDPFFWLGEINKATTVINADEGLLDKSMAPRLAAGVAKVIHDGNQPGAKRPATVITFEPLLIKAAGEDITPAVPARTCTPPTAAPSCATSCWIWRIS